MTNEKSALDSAEHILTYGNILGVGWAFTLVHTDLQLRKYVNKNHPIWDRWVKLIYDEDLDEICGLVVELWNHAAMQEEVISRLVEQVPTQVSSRNLYLEVLKEDKYCIPTWVPADTRYWDDYHRDREEGKKENNDFP